MANIRYYFSSTDSQERVVNIWDLIALIIILAVIAIFAWGATQMASPYKIGEPIPISLDPWMLPTYGIRTVLRMAIALSLSLLFTFTIGTWAAKSKNAEKIIIPAIDVLQSVPVLSFLSITVVGFIAMFPNSMLGPECASIFAIFTAQAWNMALGFYQTVSTVPHELREAADMFHLSPWKRFWRIEVPFSMSTLLWNTMMSMTASWFFVVASEAISVSNQTILLPGIGSYIKVAIDQANIDAVVHAIMAMLVIIVFYDQLFFRPLLTWSEKFKFEQNPDEKSSRSWFISLLQKTRLVKLGGKIFVTFTDKFINLSLFSRAPEYVEKEPNPRLHKLYNRLWTGTILLFLVGSSYVLLHFITQSISYREILHVFLLGFATATRVIILILLSSIIWVPVGVWIGMRPRIAVTIQPIVQFAASFPANLLFPIVVMAIVAYHLNVEIWTTPLMILGSQWYILFNVIAGASNLPKDLYQAADNFGVRGWQWWRRLVLPGIFPFYITGAITAAGGAWNASIVAEWVSWGNTTIRATGLGEYITAYSATGDFPRIALGTGMMCLFVLVFNRVLWQPLYNLAQTRFHIE